MAVTDTAFGGVIKFFDKLGVYDIVLPFLLVFTIMFAVLERTKIFGTEEVGGVKVTKKNLNALTAFCISFFVIASSKLVAIIEDSLGKIVLLILVSLSFLMLIGTFYSQDEEVILKGGWRSFFMVLMFIGVVLVFASAIPTASGTWLSWIMDYVKINFESTAVSAIILVIVIGLFMWYIIKEPSSTKSEPAKHGAGAEEKKH